MTLLEVFDQDRLSRRRSRERLVLMESACTSHEPRDRTDRSLFGYDVLGFIGEGAGSVIYAVSDPRTRQIYALKHVIRRTERDGRYIEQLENEFAVSRRVTHPGLRRCIDLRINRTLLRKPTEAALVMELYDGVPLELRAPLGVAGTLRVFLKTAAALEALHGVGYVHCDIKPNNLLIGADGMVKVIDLGQACPSGTVKKRIQGTPDFMAPEQVRCDPVSFQTDVFNLGATFYWALCGTKLPTMYTTRKSKNSFLLEERIATPREVDVRIPESLSNLVMECVRTNPSRRPVGLRELRRRLEIVVHVLKRDHAADMVA